MDNLRAVSMTDTTAIIVICCVGAVTTLFALWGLRSGRSRRGALIGLIAGIILTAIVWFLLQVAWRPFPDGIPWSLYLAGGGAAVVVLGAVFQRGRRKALAVVAVVAVINAWATANLTYQQYPTLGSLDPRPSSVAMSFDEFQAATEVPQLDGRDVGALVTVPMKGTDSQFPARDAVAYVPPAYWSEPTRQLPVLVLMAGNPGEPMQWFTVGDGAATADDFQAAHNGESPILISIDATGSLSGNPVCVDGPDLNVMTYVSQDVPQLIKEKFRVNPDQRTWTIGGLSYGGTCALQVITNHPTAYGNFLNFSGQAEPTVGTRQDTVNQFFSGDEDAFLAVNPETLLSDSPAGTYTGIGGLFMAGEKDQSAVQALTHLNDLALKQGMETSFDTVPGGHSFQVWRVALADSLEWVANRGGLS
ncbi:alpha/beta hydrolase-fold protein [Corynebacterium pacaense]|uniref:alpha/beta hydrolase-fold protein n=1 Tax=Corynebacterium pacaense TaxID=1816684 RepID=UPI0009BB9E5C|nr:alpha/beta hydrolase-fold protein [Corynebacterium pacaense]